MMDKAKYDWEALLADIDIELGLLKVPPLKPIGKLWGKSTVEWVVALLKLLILIIEKIAKTPKPDYEYYPKTGLSGEMKLDALVEYLDSKIKLPWFLEIFDGPALKFLISALVSEFNRTWGHLWLTDGNGEPVQVKLSWVKVYMDSQRAIIKRAVV